MDKTVEKHLKVAERELLIEFQPSTKCHTKIHLHSLHPTSTITFKVQTSSPHKFHVNPPTGHLPPLSYAILHVTLLPQPHPPDPLSPSDRFLVISTLPSSSSSSSTITQQTKLKVFYMGPYLLNLAASQASTAALRRLLRRQPTLSPAAATSLLAAAASSPDPTTILSLLLENGLQVPTTRPTWTRLHAAAAGGEYEDLGRAVAEMGGEGVDVRDGEGRTPLHMAAGKGCVRCVRVLLEGGADKDARSRDGRTAMHRAAANGDKEMVGMLLEAGAEAGIVSVRRRTALDVARDRGHQEVVEILERGELVLTAARRGDVKRLRTLLNQRVGVRGRDQYGLTALHLAAIKGHGEAVSLLVEAGMEMECRDVDGHTPLHVAVEGGWIETVELLLDMGADLEARNKRGATALYLARTMGYQAIEEMLLSRGASSSSSSLASASSSTINRLLLPSSNLGL